MNSIKTTKCPRCGSICHPADIRNDNTGFLIFLFGGVLPYILNKDSRDRMMVCENCKYVFTTPANSLIANAFALIIIALIVGILIFSILHVWSVQN